MECWRVDKGCACTNDKRTWQVTAGLRQAAPSVRQAAQHSRMQAHLNSCSASSSSTSQQPTEPLSVATSMDAMSRSQNLDDVPGEAAARPVV